MSENGEHCKCGKPIYYEIALAGADPRDPPRRLCYDCTKRFCEEIHYYWWGLDEWITGPYHFKRIEAQKRA